jgi:uncharacterized membrane protein
MKLTSTTTELPPSEAYAVWRDLAQRPTSMTHLDEVCETGTCRSHWRASTVRTEQGMGCGNHRRRAW